MSKTKTNAKTTGQNEDKRENESMEIRKRRNPFVMVSIDIVNDTRLSWKAKGILLYLLSKPDGWKVIINDIIKHGQGGKHAVYSALKELKKFGYYRKFPVRDGQRIIYWKSMIYEFPADYEADMKEQEKEIKNSIKKEQKSKKESEKTPITTDNSLLPDFQDIENLDIDNQDIENQQHSNININQSNLNQEVISIYQSEQKIEEEKIIDNDTASPIDMIDTNNIIKVLSKQEVADKISLDELRERHYDKTEELNMLYDCICDVLAVDNPISPTFRISKQNIPFITVKDTFNHLQKEHIDYVIHSLNNNGNKFNINKNTKSYLMTSLFNATRTISYYFNRSFSKQEEKSDSDDFFTKVVQHSMKFGKYGQSENKE